MYDVTFISLWVVLTEPIPLDFGSPSIAHLLSYSCAEFNIIPCGTKVLVVKEVRNGPPEVNPGSSSRNLKLTIKVWIFIVDETR